MAPNGNVRSRRPRRGAARRRGRRGRGRLWPWVLAALVVAAAGVGGVAWRAGWIGRAVVERVTLPFAPSAEGREVTLYFADPRWSRLVPEPRRLASSAEATATMQGLVDALAEGPRNGGAPVLPKDAQLRGAYLGADGLAVVDFDAGLASFDPGGVSGEALTVFAVVNTLAENLPEVRSVQILIGGQERETLAGHVKISEPLQPDPQWTGGTVAGAPPG